MSGAISLRGLITYQQRYVAYRVLSELAVKATSPAASGRTISGFAVEGRGESGGPVWDVRLTFSDKTVGLHECKDTAITREDRLAFYTRLRREVASGTPPGAISPVWVTDPAKQTANILASIEAIPTLVQREPLGRLPKTLPARAASARAALEEAVYQLCHLPATEAGCRRCTTAEAKTILGRLRVDRRVLEELDSSVKLLSTGVFSTGTAKAIVSHITGTLTERIFEKGEARFTVPQFLTAVKAKAIGIRAAGRIRKLLSFNAAGGHVASPRYVRWSRLTGAPQTRWSLSERVTDYDPGRSAVLVAGMGFGKTVATQMAFEELAAAEGREPSHVLRIEARALERADLDALVHLACMLTGTGPT